MATDQFGQSVASRVPDFTGLEISYLTKSFPGKRGQEYVALENIDLHIRRGEFVSLIGHSGCGKSTLLSILAGLELPTKGSVTLDGTPITAPGPERAVVFQNYSLLPWLTVEQNVAEAVEASCDHLEPLVQMGRVQTFLRAVGLWAHKDKRPHEISGGMKQRVAIARAFAIHPRVMLLDEPFGALDALTRASLQDKLNELWQGTTGPHETADSSAIETVVMVTHDIDEAIYLSDRIVVMTNGPRAGVQEIIDVPFARPRSRAELAGSLEYAALKSRLVYLLTEVLAVKDVH
jgi:nitrate/nitrite transport system ATP-binding protein